MEVYLFIPGRFTNRNARKNESFPIPLRPMYHVDFDGNLRFFL